MKNLIFAKKKLIILLLFTLNVLTDDTPVTQTPSSALKPQETASSTEKRKLSVTPTSPKKVDSKNRKLCACKGKGSRILEEVPNPQTERSMVDHNPEAVRNIDMYKGNPNGETISNNIINSTDFSDLDSEMHQGPDGQFYSSACCVDQNEELLNPMLHRPQIIIDPMNTSRPDPLMGLLAGVLGNAVHSPEMIGKPHVSGMMQITKEHMLPNGQMEVEHITEPLNTTRGGMMFGKPKIEMDIGNSFIHPSPIFGNLIHHRPMINPLTGLLSPLPMAHSPFELPGGHGMMIIGKPEVHTFTIPLNGPNHPELKPVHEEIIELGGGPKFENENLLDKFIGDLLLHRERPDVDLNEWHQRNHPPVIVQSNCPPENDLNKMLMGLLNQHNQQNRGLKANGLNRKPIKVEMEMAIPMRIPLKEGLDFKNLKNKRLNDRPDLNELMGIFGEPQNTKVTKAKATKKRKLKKSKQLDQGFNETKTKLSKEQKFLKDL